MKKQMMVTKAMAKTFAKYPLYSQDGKGGDAVVLAKFFTPWSCFTWYVLEANDLGNGDYEFFGWVEGQDSEYGYFTLSQLQSVRGPFGIRIERDYYFNNGKTTLAEVRNEKEMAY